MGVGKTGDELTGGEAQHDEGGEFLHGAAHEADYVLVVADDLGAHAVGDGHGKEEHQKNGHQRVEEGRGDDAEGLGVAQNTVFGHHGEQHEENVDGTADEGRTQTAAFFRGHGHVFTAQSAFMHGHAFETGFDELFRKEDDDGRDNEGGSRHEVPVDGGVHGEGGVDDLGGLLGDGGQAHVGTHDQNVGVQTGGAAGETGGHTGQRITAESLEDHGAEGRHHHEGGAGGHVAHDAAEGDDGGNHAAGGAENGGAKHGGEQAYFFRHAEAEHHDEHEAERLETDEVVHAALEEPSQTVDGHEALNDQRLSLGIDHGDPLQQEGENHDDQREDHEDGDGVGQPVAGAFNEAENTGKVFDLFFRHGLKLLGHVADMWWALYEASRRGYSAP